MVPNVGNFPPKKRHVFFGVFNIRGISSKTEITGVPFLSADFSRSAVSESTGVSLSDCNFPVSGFDLLGFFAIEAAASVTRANAAERAIHHKLSSSTNSTTLLTEESYESYMLDLLLVIASSVNES